jgi:hypothetical protein
MFDAVRKSNIVINCIGTMNETRFALQIDFQSMVSVILDPNNFIYRFQVTFHSNKCTSTGHVILHMWLGNVASKSSYMYRHSMPARILK